MANQLDVFWTARATKDFEKIVSFLKSNWSEKEIASFIDKLNKAVYLISYRPKLFNLTNFRKNLRRCVLTKQTTLYYKEVNSKIYIVSLHDNRRNPVSAP